MKPSLPYQEFLSTKKTQTELTGFEPGEISPLLFPWQSECVRWALRIGRAALFEDCGLGKGFGAATNVLTPTGWLPIGQLKTGNEVIGRDGRAHRVKATFHRGEQDTYRFTFSDGVSIVCDDDHLWAVKNYNDAARQKEWRVLSTKQLRATQLHYGVHGQSRTWQIPLVAPIEFQDCGNRPLHPYVLGVLLGDGSLRASTPQWTKNDPEIAERISLLLLPAIRVVRHESNEATNWSIVNRDFNPHTPNPVQRAIKELGLYGCSSPEKFVPESYLFAPLAERLALFQGLMDTDGCVGDPTPEFCSTSRRLANAVVFLVQSFGGTARLALKPEPKFTHKGEERTGLPAWRVTMSLPPSISPFSLPRKANAYYPTSRGLGRWIESIEFAGREKTICISVDSPDQLFVTEHCLVTHNTRQQLEWAHRVNLHTSKPVLIVAPLAVSQQTVREGTSIGIDVKYCRDASEAEGTQLAITNYERLEKFDTSLFSGVVCDESGILKNFSGKIKNALVEAFRDTPYKLCCTATPAPNDHMELGNHSEFLGVLPANEMLTRWFINDTSQFGTYRLKKHATKDFWDWVCSWARCVGKPSDLGYSNDGYVLPPLDIHTHRLRVDLVTGREDSLFRMPGLSATDLHREKKATVDSRVAKVAELVAQEPNEAWLIWCDTNEEGESLRNAIPGAVEVKGSDSLYQKESALLGFASGEVKILVTKSKIAGFGMNWQHCARVAYVGASYSYESFYQTIRRTWRFGQIRPVQCHVVLAETESEVWAVLQRKAQDHEKMKASMFAAARRSQLRERAVSQPYLPTHTGTLPAWLSPHQEKVECLDSAHGNQWSLLQGDCVEVIKQLPSDSLHLAVYSPPFANLYIYSDSERDMGNCADDAEFLAHYAYLVKELYRCLKPGRVAAVHCKDLVNYKGRDGMAGLRDFPGELIRIHLDAGFAYHSRVTIWKDPVIEMQRTKAHGLLYKQLCEDSTFSRQGLAEYILTFRKWAEEGEEVEPVTHTKQGRECPEFPISQWQKWASPVWMDIRQTNVLNGDLARESEDEKHICPLQLDVIERCVGLWSNPGDIVFSPFSGVGSEGYQALQMQRKFLGIELKQSYFKHAQRFLREANQQPSLFGGVL